MKITKDNLKLIIEEAVVRLYEERHVAKEVEQWTDKIYNKIYDRYGEIAYKKYNFPVKYGDSSFVSVKYRFGMFDLVVEPFSTVRVEVYDFNDLDDLNAYIDTHDLDSEYRKTINGLLLRLVSIGGKMSEIFTKRMISHETRHWFDMLNSGIDNSRLYNKARAVMKQYSDRKDNVNYLIALLLYWFNTEEINANCQGLYGELEVSQINEPNEAKTKTNIYNEFITLESIYNRLFKTFNNEISWFECRLFLNMSLGRISNYLRKQIGYTRKRFDKVVSLYLSRKKQINEGLRNGGILKPKIF